MADGDQRLIVGIAGSSAVQLGMAFLRACQGIDGVETHLVLSPGAARVIEIELGTVASEVEALADAAYRPRDMAAAISSGSFMTAGMVVIPCSMRALAAIATGVTDDLLTRAADVVLKERRRLVLVPRETPLNLIHLRNMETVTLAGATILPPMLTFYNQPQTINDLLLHTCGKVLDQFGIDHQLYRRWA